jgi:hypothetical protein
MRVLLWARRSLSTSATSFKVRNTSTNPASAVLARCRGFPCDRCHARCAFHAARLFLFEVQRRFELDAPQRATRDSPTLGLESRAPKARKPSPPRVTPFKWTRRTWETRRPKEPSKGRRARSCDRARPSSACAPRSLLLALSSTFCHRRCVRDGMEARSRACTRSHRWPRRSFRLPPREGRRLSEHLGCFPPLESNDGRDRSLGHPTGPPRYATVISGFAAWSVRAFVTNRPRPKLTALKRGAVRLDWSFGCCPPVPVAAPLRLEVETVSTTRPLAELTYRELREALCQFARSRSTKIIAIKSLFFQTVMSTWLSSSCPQPHAAPCFGWLQRRLLWTVNNCV